MLWATVQDTGLSSWGHGSCIVLCDGWGRCWIRIHSQPIPPAYHWVDINLLSNLSIYFFLSFFKESGSPPSVRLKRTDEEGENCVCMVLAWFKSMPSVTQLMDDFPHTPISPVNHWLATHTFVIGPQDASGNHKDSKKLQWSDLHDKTSSGILLAHTVSPLLWTKHTLTCPYLHGSLGFANCFGWSWATVILAVCGGEFSASLALLSISVHPPPPPHH